MQITLLTTLKTTIILVLWLHPSIGYRVIKGLNIEPLREYLTDDDPIIQFTDTQKVSMTKDQEFTLAVKQDEYDKITSIIKKLLDNLTEQGKCPISVKSYPEENVIKSILDSIENVTYELRFLRGIIMKEVSGLTLKKMKKIEYDFYTALFITKS